MRRVGEAQYFKPRLFSIKGKVPSVLTNSASLRDRVDVQGLSEIGRLGLSPCSMANRQYPHRLPLFIDFIDDSIKRGASCREASATTLVSSFDFPAQQAAIGISSQPRHSLLQPVVPSRGRLRLWGVLFPDKEAQDREPRDPSVQRRMSCLRRISSKTSRAGRVCPCATSSRLWRMPSSASARAAMSSNRW